MPQSIDEKVRFLNELEPKVPLRIWLAAVIDAMSGVLPPNSSLSRELASMQDRVDAQGTPTVRKAEEQSAGQDIRLGIVNIAGAVEQSAPMSETETQPSDASIRQTVHAILDYAEKQSDIRHSISARQEFLGEIREELKREADEIWKGFDGMRGDLRREAEGATKEIRYSVDRVITEQLLKHKFVRLPILLLAALAGAFLGIDVWMSKQVSTAKDGVAKMQEQIHGAEAAIFSKESELNKALRDAQDHLAKSADAAGETLAADAKRAAGEVEWVKGEQTKQLKEDAAVASRAIRQEQRVQLEALRRTALKLTDLQSGYTIALLWTLWLLPVASLLMAILAIIAWRRTKKKLGS